MDRSGEKPYCTFIIYSPHPKSTIFFEKYNFFLEKITLTILNARLALTFLALENIRDMFLTRNQDQECEYQQL